MSSTLIRLRKFVLAISPEETSFARRGFREGEPAVCRRLEQIGKIFLQGYHSALEEDEPRALVRKLNEVQEECRGFAFEGAAMGLALLDHLTPLRRNRWVSFFRGPGMAHAHMLHVGFGWAVARLPWLRWNVERPLAQIDPLLRWLAVDGYGFHEGYFHWRRFVDAHATPKRLSGYARRVFDQGLGRSLWFVDGADISRIPATIAAFPSSRHADLWSGVGLACAYAGGVDRETVEALRAVAGPYGAQLAQGAAFAAKARQRAGNVAENTEIACVTLCGLSAKAAAKVTDVWRHRIQLQFANPESGAARCSNVA
jgi:hypothetical protein